MATNVNRRKSASKPKRRPSDTFPLFLHRNGQWAKKIRGRHRYFDKAKALERYQREVGLLSRGLEPEPGDLGVRELFNRYLSAKQRAVQAGKMGARALADSAGTLRRVIGIPGDRLVSALVPADFAQLNQRLSRGRSAVTVSGDGRRTKAAFRWALHEGIIAKLPNFGSEFPAAPIRVLLS